MSLQLYFKRVNVPTIFLRLDSKEFHTAGSITKRLPCQLRYYKQESKFLSCIEVLELQLPCNLSSCFSDGFLSGPIDGFLVLLSPTLKIGFFYIFLHL